MAATVVCQSNPISQRRGVERKSAALPVVLPLGYARPQTATFAASGALAYGSNMLSSAVRNLPRRVKADEDSNEDALASFVGRRESKTGRPSFRSALEQVSYETNSSLAGDNNPEPTGVVGKIARLFGK